MVDTLLIWDAVNVVTFCFVLRNHEELPFCCVRILSFFLGVIVVYSASSG